MVSRCPLVAPLTVDHRNMFQKLEDVRVTNNSYRKLKKVLLFSQITMWWWIQGWSPSSCPAKPLFACIKLRMWSGRTETIERYMCMRMALTKQRNRTCFTEVE